MEASFIGQPFDDGEALGATLTHWLRGAEKFTACVAWSQTSGLDQLAADLSRLRERGGEAVAIVGIDGGIATNQGLLATLDAFSKVSVFHDLGARTFHPKLYVVAHRDERLVVVGSSNLTEGGLYTNYEASLALRLRVGEKSDDALLGQVERYLTLLSASGMPVRDLTRAMVDQLAGRAGVLARETERRRQIRVQLAQAEGGLRDLFGASPSGLLRAPRTRRRRVAPGLPSAAPARPRRAPVEASWSKVLTVSDAMRKTVGNQRAYVILGKAGHKIDQKTYFRRRFFAGATWTREKMRTGSVKEVANIAFQVILEDQVLGDFRILVDHSAKRIANQNNAPTWLHWSSLMDVVRQTDLSGYTLTLERLSGGGFRLRLAR